jgi:alcohol dehydrogenase class IV
LEKRLAASFTAAFEQVPLEIVIEAVVVARRCDADLIIAMGGGSVIDAGKAIRTCLAANPNSSQLLGSFMEHREPLAVTLIPQISIPITLSGSEYTRSFSTTDYEVGAKALIRSIGSGQARHHVRLRRYCPHTHGSVVELAAWLADHSPIRTQALSP